MVEILGFVNNQVIFSCIFHINVLSHKKFISRYAGDCHTTDKTPVVRNDTILVICEMN